jgi:hypothetical protein
MKLLLLFTLILAILVASWQPTAANAAERGRAC